MEYEIHMFSAVAVATSATRFPPGERHPLLVFLRQAVGAGHDLRGAADAAQGAGWLDIDITRAGTLPEDAATSMEENVRAAYHAAVEAGAGLLAFDAVVRPAPRKT